MEELADAIEDAQYVNAISTQDDGPRPVLPWEKPTDEELRAWQERVVLEHKQRADPQCEQRPPFGMEWVCQQQIGFFLFSQYIKEVHDDYPRINFVEEVLRYQCLQERTVRLEKAVVLAHHFLGLYGEKQPSTITPTRPVSSTAEDTSNEDPNELADANPVPRYSWPLPPRTEIEEYDLARGCILASGAKVHTSSTLSFTTTQSKRQLFNEPRKEGGDSTHLKKQQFSSGMTRPELDAMCAVNLDCPICSECVIGVKGPVRKEIIQTLESCVTPQQMDKILQKSLQKETEKVESSLRYGGAGRNSVNGLGQLLLSSKDLEREKVAAALEALTNSSHRRHSHHSAPVSLQKKSVEECLDQDNKTSNSKRSQTISHGDNVDPEDNHPNRRDDVAPPAIPAPNRHLTTSKSVFLPPKPSTVNKPIKLEFDFFNRAEQVVLESLRRDYWTGFLSSPHWVKLLHFLWYQDRRVVAEDFFVMRVLGRGGFGLVTGTCIG